MCLGGPCLPGGRDIKDVLARSDDTCDEDRGDGEVVVPLYE